MSNSPVGQTKYCSQHHNQQYQGKIALDKIVVYIHHYHFLIARLTLKKMAVRNHLVIFDHLDIDIPMQIYNLNNQLCWTQLLYTCLL